MSFDNNIKFAVIFPGQGSQYIKMGKSLYNKYQIARDTFNLANETLNFSLSSLCFNGDIHELTKTYNAQPAILTVSYIMYQIYIKEKNLKPSLLLGHSLGEISALVCADSIRFTDGLKIVRNRGLYMQECENNSKGSMIAIISDKLDLIKELCNSISTKNSIVEIANYNSNNQIVVSGNNDSINILREKLKEKNIRNVKLNVSAAFHSSIMKPAANKLGSYLQGCKYRPLSVPVISNVSGDFYSSSDDIIKNLQMQMFKPVQWVQSVQRACNLGINLFIEVGPKNVLKNLNKNICKDIPTLSLDSEEDLNKFNLI